MWRGRRARQRSRRRAGYGATVDLEAADPGRGVRRGCAELVERDRPHARAPVRRPARRSPARARSALEMIEDVPDVDTSLVPVGGGGLVSGIAAAVASDRASRHRRRAGALAGAARRRSRPGKPVPGRARARSPTAWRALRRRARARSLRARGSTTSCSSPRTRSRTRCASSTRARSSPASRPAPPRRRAPGRQDRRSSGPWLRVVSGGNVAAETPLLSWSGNEGRNSSRVRPRDRPLLLRQRVRDALHEARAPRRGLLDCHPFYTGKQKLMDSGGRVERFQRRLEKAGGARSA